MDISSIITAVRELNSTLKRYEPYYAFAKRLPYLEDIRCETFRQYIEIRLNNEIFFNVPELSEFEEKFSGELFNVIAVYDQDEEKCRFKEVEATINTNPASYVGDGDYLEEIEDVKNILGGNTIKFNYSQKKTKVTII